MEGMPIPDYVRNIGGFQEYDEVEFKGTGEMMNLPALVSIHENVVRSFWLPTKEEIEAMKNGQYVMLSIWGSQPPVTLQVI